MYFYIKNKEELLLHMGPVWDFDSSRQFSDEWASMHCYDGSFTKYLWEYDTFDETYQKLWQNIKDHLMLNISSQLHSLDIAELDKARRLEIERWEWKDVSLASEEVVSYEEYFRNRIDWLSCNICNAKLTK